MIISHLYNRWEYVIKAHGTFEKACQILVSSVVNSVHGAGGAPDSDRDAALRHTSWHRSLTGCSGQGCRFYLHLMLPGGM